MHWLKKKTVLLVMAVATVFLLIIFAVRSPYQFPLAESLLMRLLVPVQTVAAEFAQQVHLVTGSVGRLLSLQEENKHLQDKLAEQKREDVLLQEALAENQRLRSMLDFKTKSSQYDLLPATVIARDPESWTRILVINRGNAEGVAKNMPVITPQGLVGHVVHVYVHSAKVQLLLDPRSAVGAVIQRPKSRLAGVVEGYAQTPLYPRMVNLSRDADVQEGDRVVTSGFGGIYPKGLLVGEVCQIVEDPGGLVKSAMLKPAVDFDRLEEVMVILFSREAPPQPLPVKQEVTEAGQPQEKQP